jgi:addiction module RelE/StbE family toxin
MKVEISASAEADLEEIFDFVAKDSPQRALSFVMELRDVALRLADAPRAFPVHRRGGWSDIRRRRHRDYLIFYHVSDDRLVIIKILHGARDYDALLPDLE